MIALFGAGGAVGHSLAVELDKRGLPYRVVGRNIETLQREFPNAEVARADFFKGEGTLEAAEGIETVFYLAGAPYTEFDKHPIMVRNALDGAITAGVARFVLVVPVYAYGAAQSVPVPESQPHDPQTHKGRYRLEQEQAVLQAGKRGGMLTMAVHMPDFYGPFAELSYANAFMREVFTNKTASWLGPASAQREFLFAPDIAEPLLRLSDDPQAYGRCWNLGGTAVTAKEFIDLVFVASGKKPKYNVIPKFVVQAFGLFNPMMREIAEMYYLFDSGFVLDDTELRAQIGDWPKTPLEQGIRQTFAWMSAHPAPVSP